MNNYNEFIYRLIKSNMDLKLIFYTYQVLNYIAKYACKPEVNSNVYEK